jgi:uncharacterized protein (DUF58 family)
MSAIQTFDAVGLAAIHARMKGLASVARLPLRSGQWSGVAGSVLGQGTGSSIDFQDQRPYLPGDDPRHINWLAYARSGSYTMKLYRQEVTPRVDLLFDVSASMYLNESKSQRTWELLYWGVESALRLGASLKVHLLGDVAREAPLEQVLAHDWSLHGGAKPDVVGGIERTPLRSGSLRVFLSDVLSDSPPERAVNALLRGRGRAIILAPYCRDEAQPDWQGNIEFEECELDSHDKRRVDAGILSRYHRAYAMHFAMWREQCSRRGVGFARVAAETGLLAALRAEAAAAGCVEMS